MDNNNWRPALPKREPDMDTDDWRTHLPPDSRQKIVNNIMEKLMRHLPFSGAEGMNEARTIAASFEVEIFSGAVDQTDYLRKISMKMLSMETEWQNAAGSSSSSSLLTIREASKKRPLNLGHLMDNVDSLKKDANKTVQYVTGPSLPSGEPVMTTYDWRTQLPHDSREKIVNKITETLHKHLPASPEELRRIATRFEEKILSGATNQTDYLRKISMKMLTMETEQKKAAGSSSSSLPVPDANKSLPLNLGCHHQIRIVGQVKAEPAVNTSGDWRTCLPPDSRKMNVNKIKVTLKKHVPNCGEEGNKELKKIAESFEELIFNTSIDQVDYFRKVSFKMQTTNEGD